RVDTRIKTDVKIRCNRPDIFILDKKKNKITLIEVGITSQDSLQIVETEKLRKYDLLANELGLIYRCSVEIIPYVMTWDGIVTKYHKTYAKRLQIPMNIEAYIQASLSVILGAEMHKQPIPPLKQVDNEEDDVKTQNTKNILLLILNGITPAEEPTTNTNEELELEEETIVVKESDLEEEKMVVKEIENYLKEGEKEIKKKPPKKNMSKIWIDGCFDIFHYGHANALRKAKSMGTYLIAGVHSTKEISLNKGLPVMTDEERYEVVRACRYVDEIIENAPFVTQLSVIQSHNCHIVVHGNDPIVDENGNDCYQEVKKKGMFREFERTLGISTTEIVGRMLLKQKPTPELCTCNRCDTTT
ncbi:ethanolamine-phosphate cytidylyltransferase, partial [Hamiltosporidium magnivora]